jgi:hypothetical protein
MHPFTVTFDIEFSFKGSRLSAVVHRYNTRPIQYLVMMEKGNNLNISLPLVLTANTVTGILENPSFERNLIDPISNAIYSYCRGNEIPVT